MDNPASQKEKSYRLAIRRPVTTGMIFLTLVVFGIKSYQHLPINLMPNISYPTLTVRTEYEGAAPEDVEKLLTRPLEETLSIVTGLVEISSVSAPGLSEIIMEFTWDTDMNLVQQEVRDRLDLYNPPQGVTENPVILRYDPTLDPVMRAAITGRDFSHVADPDKRAELIRNELTAIREAAERHLKNDVEGEVTGVAQVAVRGGREQEIQVLVDSERLKHLGLSLDQIKNSLAQQNINLSGGPLKEGRTEYLVRTLNEFQSVDEIKKVIIALPNGQTVRLIDVAKVLLGEKERKTIVSINGNEAVMLEIYKEGDANTVEVCNVLKDFFNFEREEGLIELIVRKTQEVRAKKSGLSPEEIDKSKRLMMSRLPKSAKLTLISDQSRFIVGSIQEVKRTALVGGCLALIVLLFFLREIKSTIIIGVAIPISIIATFIPMFFQGVSLNIMSLGGLALGVGMLVDNSIVVLESIFRCREEGDQTVDAAQRGTHEVGSAVIASTLTTIAVFLPIAFVEGVAGQLFRDQALTVTFSLMASLLVALYLIPMIASRKKLSLSGGNDVVWLLRAYREGREEREQGRILAFFCVPLQGPRYLWRSIAESWQRTPGAALAAIVWKQESPPNSTALKILISILAIIFLLPAIAVFLIEVVLKLLLSIAVTLLFLTGLSLLSFFWVLGLIFKASAWLPFKLFDLAFKAFGHVYVSVLGVALQLGPVILLLVAAVAVHAGMVAQTLGRELIPPLKQGEFGIQIEAPPGTRIEETARRASLIEELASEIPDVAIIAVQVGSEKAGAGGNRGENSAEVTVLLKDPDRTAKIQDSIVEKLRERVLSVLSDEVAFTLPTLFSFKTAIELQIKGDDLKVLKRIGNEALEAIKDVPGLKDAELSLREGYPEIIIELDRDKLASKNLTVAQIATRLRTEIQGDIASQFSSRGDKIDIRVRTDQDRLSSLQDLRMLSVVEGTSPIPLSDVARITVQEGPSEIRRSGQRRVAVITANIQGRDLGAVSADVMTRMENVQMPSDYEVFLGGQNRELQTSYRSLQFALILAIFLVYVVMACQFESVWHPALIMFSVPLAFIGVVYALYYLQINLSVIVFIGGIVLAGIVVNNAIVLVDYINQLRARGLKKRLAIIEACKIRLRPILMTTLTTVLGLIPMALYSGEGAEIRRPLAITVIAGLTSSTILTLLIIPMVYDLFGGRDKTS